VVGLSVVTARVYLALLARIERVHGAPDFAPVQAL
jgi:hypothetical protein